VGKRIFHNLTIAFVILLAYAGIAFSQSTTQTSSDSLDAQRYIPLIDRQTLLLLQQEGKRILFVDARENQEFKEEHILGAINITLRDIPLYKNEIAQSGDIIVAYCLKDFRGYEVAKALKTNGLENVYTMAVPGLNGWKASKLPTKGDRVVAKSHISLEEKG